MSFIKLSQVNKRYPDGHQALSNVSCEVAAGEMVFLTGHSGAGKSTLLKLLAAIERPTSGSVLVGGQNLAALKPFAIPILRRNLGLVFQDHKLLFDRSVFDNAMLPLSIIGYPPKEAAKRVRAALDKVGLLSKEKALPITLSGGEQQRLCIARAVVNRPSILLADEPTGNLDAQYAEDIMQLFTTFNQVGTTVLISTHDEAVLSRYANRRLHLEQGRLVA
ncbi:cell division ATP-binding protein FtsE [Leeia sp.]|uniref:cell division ATP-binding protein FtsE n=1 Tax=Leeia sp. TaxID=2884678 RepID=UPI0035B0A88D